MRNQPALAEPQPLLKDRFARSGPERHMAGRRFRAGGTMTGEHGTGIGKKDLMAMEYGKAWKVMARIRRALDPDDILDPGRVVEMAQ